VISITESEPWAITHGKNSLGGCCGNSQASTSPVAANNKSNRSWDQSKRISARDGEECRGCAHEASDRAIRSCAHRTAMANRRKPPDCRNATELEHSIKRPYSLTARVYPTLVSDRTGSLLPVREGPSNLGCRRGQNNRNQQSRNPLHHSARVQARPQNPARCGLAGPAG
jgi:hypothetical protein